MMGNMAQDFTKDLDRIRAGIDETDDGIVELLARRRTLVLELAKIKKVLNAPIYDRKREQALVELSDAELARLFAQSQPSEMSPEAGYAP